MLRGGSGEDVIVKNITSFFAEELEACAKNFMSFNDLKALFIMYVGVDTPQVCNVFRYFCRTLLINQFPRVKDKLHRNMRGYVNVGRKVAH